MFGTQKKTIGLSNLYFSSFVANQKLPKGTTVYVGETTPTGYEIETFTGKSAVEIWKIRIPEFAKPQVLSSGLSKKYVDADFLYLIYYKKNSQITEEEKVYLKRGEEEAERNQAVKSFIAAARSGDLSTANDMLSTQPELIHTSDASGWTAITAAAKANQVEMVRYLLQQGADPEANNKLGQSAVQVTKQQKNQSLLYILYAHRDRNK